MIDGSIVINKNTGKIGAVNPESFSDVCSLAMAHTRWATHGGVTVENAHPHLSADQNIAVVHNGIVENYQALRDELKKKRYVFRSETDTEVICHLLQEEMKSGGTFPDAVRHACMRFDGRYAFVALNAGTHELIAARRGSPLIIGIGKGETFIASDIPAFMEHTRTVNYLDDGEMAVTNGEKTLFFDLKSGREIKKRNVEITWDRQQAEKGEY